MFGNNYVFLTVFTSRQHRGTRHDLRFHIGTGTRCLSTDEEHIIIRFSLYIYTIITLLQRMKRNIAKGTTDPGVDCFDQ